MGSKYSREAPVKRGLQFFYNNYDDVFRMVLTRLLVQYRTYWALKALGLSKEFDRGETMKAALEDKSTNRYRCFIRELGWYLLETNDCIILSARGCRRSLSSASRSRIAFSEPYSSICSVLLRLFFVGFICLLRLFLV